ncbi:MAG: GerMN domain-containing protein [Clostridiaceae bacterium]|nr:GerMN domain-containing protein [Clostridiaceae bacterium]MBW4859621.1 GerMN domain-containing protein [Clostridiaceae bacterium]MBW4868590.1 GerMN domain-containing protein [Clostridiaceae bacterium]
MRKKCTLIILSLILSIFTSSCQSYDVLSEESNNFPPINPISKDKVEVILYYPNSEMEHLVPEVRVVPRSNERIEEMVISELLKGTNRKGFKNIIPENVEMLSLDILDDIAYVSFSDELYNKSYGEKEEAFIIYSIVNTLASIPDINRVQIFINGKAINTLFRHYSVREPLAFSSIVVSEDYINPVSILNKYYDNLLDGEYDKSMDMLYLSEIEKVKLNTLRIYLENEFKGVEQFDITDYIIYEYGDKISMDAEIVFTYEKNNKKSSYKKIELVYDKDKFKIKGLLY